MESLRIHTGREGFLLLDAIRPPEAESIEGVKTFYDAPIYEGIEALAQLGALHVRHRLDFSRQVFLLSFRRFTPPESPTLSGRFLLTGTLAGGSQSAWSYRLSAVGDEGNRFSGTFLFSAVDYDDKFKKDILQPHYRKVFECLKSASKNV